MNTGVYGLLESFLMVTNVFYLSELNPVYLPEGNLPLELHCKSDCMPLEAAMLSC
jgi:hypothetical protein